MFAALSIAAVIAAGATAPPPAADEQRARALARVMDEARRDFEQRHGELGLLGAAPLPGVEPARGEAPAAEAAPAAARRDQRAVEPARRQHRPRGARP